MTLNYQKKNPAHLFYGQEINHNGKHSLKFRYLLDFWENLKNYAADIQHFIQTASNEDSEFSSNIKEGIHYICQGEFAHGLRMLIFGTVQFIIFNLKILLNFIFVIHSQIVKYGNILCTSVINISKSLLKLLSLFCDSTDTYNNVTEYRNARYNIIAQHQDIETERADILSKSNCCVELLKRYHQRKHKFVERGFKKTNEFRHSNLKLREMHDQLLTSLNQYPDINEYKTETVNQLEAYSNELNEYQIKVRELAIAFFNEFDTYLRYHPGFEETNTTSFVF